MTPQHFKSMNDLTRATFYTFTLLYHKYNPNIKVTINMAKDQKSALNWEAARVRNFYQVTDQKRFFKGNGNRLCGGNFH